MARKLEVEILANTVGYTKGLVKAGEQAKAFAGSVDESTKHIGRSLALMTGGFVAFAGATDFVKASIDAARDAGVSQRQLAAQMKASGESFAASQAAIDKAGLSLSKLGFTSEDSTKALTVLERGTGRITEAIKLQGLAADIARVKGLKLADAANVVAKVFGGQESALRRAVPGLEKQAHGLDLIAEAQQRLAGQAKAATTPAEAFSSALFNTEKIVGQALLPDINKLLTALTGWLDKMNESGRLQRDMNEAVKDGTALFHDLEPWVERTKTAFKDLGDVTGGTKNEVELLVAAFAAFKGAKVATSIANVITGVRGIGTSAKTSTGEVAGLRGALVGLAGPAAIVAGVLVAGKELGGLYNGSGAQKFMDNLLGNNPSMNLPQLRAQAKESGIEGAIARQVLSQLPASVRASKTAGVYGPPAPPVVSRVNVPGGVAGSYGNGPLSAQQRLELALAADPSNVGLLQQQAAHDRAAIAFAQKLRARGTIDNKTFVAETKSYTDDLVSTLSTITGIQSDAASKTADAAAKSAAANRKAVDAAKARAEAGRKLIASLIGRQHESPEQYVARAEKPGAFERLGPIRLADFNVPFGIQLAESKATATGNTAGLQKALRAAKASAVKALASGKLSLAAQKEAWDAITDLNSQLASQATATKTDVTKLHQAPLPRAFALAGGGGITIHNLNLHGIQDVAGLENELEARAKRRPQPRRGR